MHRLFLSALALLIAANAYAARSPRQPTPDSSDAASTDAPVELPAEVMVIADDLRTPLNLTLPEAVELTVGQNPQLIGARMDEAIADAEKLRAMSAFVPVFGADFGMSRSWREATADSGSPNSSARAVQGGASLTTNIPTGTTLRTSVRVAETSNDARTASFSRDHFATVRFELTQSLLKRIGLGVDLSAYLSAAASHKAAEQRLQFVCEQIVQRVGTAYFNTFELAEAYKARREGRRLAIDLYELTKKRISNGSAAPYEIFQAQSSLAARYSTELSAEQSLDISTEGLLQLFNARIRNDGRVMATNFLVITEDPQPVHTGETTVQLFELAQKNRPDYLATQFDIDGANALRYAAWRNQLPELRASGFVEGQGAAGFLSDPAILSIINSQATFDPRRIGSLGDSFQNIRDLSFWNWGFTVSLEVPLYLGAERANYRIATAAVTRTMATRVAIEQALRTDVAVAHAQQARAMRRVTIAKASLEAAKQNLSAETKKMKLGSSTNFDVLRIQEEVINAYVNIATAKAELGRAIVNLRFALGEGRDGMNFDVQTIFTNEETRKRRATDTPSPSPYP